MHLSARFSPGALNWIGTWTRMRFSAAPKGRAKRIIWDVVSGESTAATKMRSKPRLRIWLRDLDSTAQQKALQRGPKGVSEANHLGHRPW